MFISWVYQRIEACILVDCTIRGWRRVYWWTALLIPSRPLSSDSAVGSDDSTLLVTVLAVMSTQPNRDIFVYRRKGVH